MFKKSGTLSRCPLDPLHVVPEDRLQTHLIKCMKKNPGSIACPYNAVHRFLTNEDQKAHILVCPNKRLIEQWRYSKIKDSSPVDLDIPESNEDWGSEYQQ